MSIIYIWIGACLKQYCGVGNFAPICQDHNCILFSIHATKELNFFWIMVFFKVQAEAERQRNVRNMSSFEDENELKSFEYAH